MVVRLMLLRPFTQCSSALNFSPRQEWPKALPAIAFRGTLVCAFERSGGLAVDLEEGSLLEVLRACHPQLGLGELSRLYRQLSLHHSEWTREVRENLFDHYGLRWCDRLEQTLMAVVATPLDYQNFTDSKGFSVRDHGPLLSLPEISQFGPFLKALADLNPSKSEATRILELGVELFLLSRPFSDLLPADDRVDRYLARLEKWRRPETSGQDEQWKSTVAAWPWPSQVQGHWQRFGDQSGLEIKIRTTSPEDLNKKLQRLLSIGDSWSCKM
jgi:hypothetical protein